MKTKDHGLSAGPLAVLVLFLTLKFTGSAALAQSTAFTYQGMLNDGGTAANGVYDLRFTLFDSTNTSGSLIAGPATNSATIVSKGLFYVTLDFGSNVFSGSYRCLQIEVRTNGASEFTPLAPCQPITPVPYAITAGNLTGLIPASQIIGAVSAGQLPIKSFTSTNGFFALAQNPDGSTAVTFVVTNVCGANGAGGGSATASYSDVNGFDVSSVTIISTNMPPPGLVHKLAYVAGGQTNAQFEILRGLWTFNASDLSGSGGIHPAPMTNTAVESIQLYFDFVLDGSYFVFAMQTKNTTPVLTINGIDYTNVPALPVDQNRGWYFYKVQFQSSGRRNITIKMLSDDFGNEGFGGLWIDPSFGWISAIPGKKYKLWYVGSSHSETPGPGAGLGANYLNDVDYGADLMKLFVNLDCHAEGSGGTGVVNPGASFRTNYIGRLGDVYLTKPDFIGIEALANDTSYPSNTFATNFSILIQNITNNLPGVPIVVWTSPFLNGTAASVNNYAALTNEIALLGLTNFIDTLADPLFPPGYNPAVQQAGGGPHLSPMGEWVYAEALASRLAQFFPSLIPSDYTAPTLPLTIPTGFSATAGSNIVNLSWNTPFAGATSYVLNRGFFPGGEAFFTNVIGTNFADMLVVNGSNYFYTVCGVLNNSTSPPSYEVAAMPTAYIPSPTNVSMQLLRWLNPGYGIFADQAGTTPATNGQLVALWKDESTNHNDVYGVGGNAGRYYPAGVTGSASVNTDSKSACVFTNAYSEQNYSNITIVCAVAIGYTNGGYIFDTGPNGNSGSISMSLHNGMYSFYGNYNAGIAMTNLMWYMISYNQTNPASGNFYTNGVVVSANHTINAGGMNGLTIGIRNDLNPGLLGQCVLMDFIEYSGNPTPADVLVLSNYFASKGVHN